MTQSSLRNSPDFSQWSDGELTRYFTPSFRRKRKIIEIDDSVNHITGACTAKQVSTSGTQSSSLQIDSKGNERRMESVVALARIMNARTSPRKPTVRAGDPDTYILRAGTIIGRSLTAGGIKSIAPKRFRNQKIDLGIHGADSGVSRKQLQVTKLNPLTFKQLKTVTNQVHIHRFNHLTKEMQSKPKLIEPGESFVLKYGDVITMDGFRGITYKHCFRIVKCLTPILRERKKHSDRINKGISKIQVVDLVRSESPVNPLKNNIMKSDEKSAKFKTETGRGQNEVTRSESILSDKSLNISFNTPKRECKKMKVVDKTNVTRSKTAISYSPKSDLSATLSFLSTNNGKTNLEGEKMLRIKNINEKKEFERTIPTTESHDIVIGIGDGNISAPNPLKLQDDKILNDNVVRENKVVGNACSLAILKEKTPGINKTGSKTTLTTNSKADLFVTLALTASKTIQGKNIKMFTANGNFQETKSEKLLETMKKKSYVPPNIRNAINPICRKTQNEPKPSMRGRCGDKETFFSRRCALPVSKPSTSTVTTPPVAVGGAVSDNERLKENFSQSNTMNEKETTALRSKDVRIKKKDEQQDITPSLLPEPEENEKEKNIPGIGLMNADKKLKDALGPKVDDYLRVKYKTTDTFETEENPRYYESWWLGTVKKVTRLRGTGKATHKIKINFMDNSSLEFEFPDKDIQKLEHSDIGSGLLYAIIPSENGSHREKAFERNPKKLVIGDLVDAHYQNGKDHNRWHRGRIASIDAKTKRCTIAYDDGVVERFVPTDEGKIILVDNGCSCLEWVLNLGVYDDYDRRKKKRKRKIPGREIGTVTGVDYHGRVKVTISFRTGSKSGWVYYEDFVIYIFESLLSRYKSTKEWPSIKREKKHNKFVTFSEKKTEAQYTSSLLACKEDGEELGQCMLETQKEIDRKERELAKLCNHKLEVPKTLPHHDKDRLISEKVDFRELKLPRKKQVKTRKARGKAGKFSEKEWDEPEILVDGTDTKKIPPMKEIHPTLSNSFFRALNTSEPLLGADLLMHTIYFHHRGMNPNLGRDIRMLLMDGPMSEGTHFPDPHRLEAMMMYLKKLALAKNGNENITKSCSPEGWSTLQDMVQNILEPGYAYEQDERNGDVIALERVSDSLHLSAIGSQLLGKLLKPELEELVHQKRAGKGKCREGSLAKAIWNNEYGSRRSMQDLSKAFVQAWLRYGHYSFCPLSSFKFEVGSAPLLRNCRENAKVLLKELGSVLSYAFWLYSVVEDIRLSDKDLAFIIRDAFENESIKSTFEHCVFKPKKEKMSSFEAKFKIRLVLGLDSELVSDIQTNLANEFGIQNIFSLFSG
mmetsp:Transcript_8504/g.9715  ORF Transcript_8504/g.9715 Transcript_8504/m.9715 type:complete len:1330 (+) Transcript_8504:311-4300(+)